MEWLSGNCLWVTGGLLTLFFIYLFTRPGRPTGRDGGGKPKRKAKMSPEIIDGFFERYGWKYRRKRPDLWQTGWRSSTSLFPMFVKLTRHWIYFTISPFVVGPKGLGHRGKLYHHLLRLNRDIDMAKFGVDNEGDVVLTVELPCANLDYEEFVDAIKALCHIADETYGELLRLTKDPNAPSRYDEWRFV